MRSILPFRIRRDSRDHKRSDEAQVAAKAPGCLAAVIERRSS